MIRKITTRITGIMREPGNGDGNPRYTVTTSNGTFKTVKGGQVAWGITNSEYQGEVVLTLDRSQIVGVSTVDGKTFTGRQE